MTRRARTAVTVLVVLAGAGVAAWSRFDRVVVTGASMAPTLRPGDRLLVRRGRRAPVGALVVVCDPRDPRRRVVKRLVAIEPAGAVVLGDNPGASTDSRAWGPVPWSLVHGRVLRRYAPPERAGTIDDGRPPKEDRPADVEGA